MTERLDVAPVDGLIDSRGLADRLGVSPATIRSWRNRGAGWLPEPIGRLDGLVWRVSDLEGIEDLLPLGPGRPSSRSPAEIGLTRTPVIELPSAAQARRRALGAYYTPRDAAHYLASWIVRRNGETVLEPSFGDGAFINAVNDETARRGYDRPTWIAAEVDERAAGEAVQRHLLHRDEVRVGDFLSLDRTPVDAAIANPPYIRLRHLPNDMRERALRRSDELGHPMSPSGSVWMPFVAHMVSFLRTGGRAAIVLPLDFTYVTYAKPLWKYLGQRFGTLKVIRVRERIFSGINQDVLLLLADGYGGSTERITFAAFESHADLLVDRVSVQAEVSLPEVLTRERAFQKALLPKSLTALLDSELSAHTVAASEYMKFRIGYVAGNKHYFHPPRPMVERYNLQTDHLRPAVINARRLRGHGLRTSGMTPAAADVLWHPTGTLTNDERRYVSRGEAINVHQGYKASQRSTWYIVPGVTSPDVIITVFSEHPLLLINDADWVASNSLLCGYVEKGTADGFARSWYTPLTLLSIGLQVHSLGGGVLVMVPNEASSVQILRPDNRPSRTTDSTLDLALAEGDLRAAYQSGHKRVQNLAGSEALDLINRGIEVLAHWRAR